MKASQAHAGAPRRTRQKTTYRDGVTVERYRQHRAVTNDVNFLVSPHQRHAPPCSPRPEPQSLPLQALH